MEGGARLRNLFAFPRPTACAAPFHLGAADEPSRRWPWPRPAPRVGITSSSWLAWGGRALRQQAAARSSPGADCERVRSGTTLEQVARPARLGGLPPEAP